MGDGDVRGNRGEGESLVGCCEERHHVTVKLDYIELVQQIVLDLSKLY